MGVPPPPLRARALSLPLSLSPALSLPPPLSLSHARALSPDARVRPTPIWRRYLATTTYNNTRPAQWDDYTDLPPLSGGGTAGTLFNNAAIVLKRTFKRLVDAAGGAADASRWELVTGTPQLVPQLAPIQVSGVSADAVLNPQTV